jgi:hypothetical protein
MKTLSVRIGGPVMVETKPGRFVRPTDPDGSRDEYEARLRLGACSPLEKKDAK